MRQTPEKKKVLIFDPVLKRPGGGQFITAWTIEALKHDYDVTVITWDEPALEALNRYYGTSLNKADVTFYLPPQPLRFFGELITRLDPDPQSFQRSCILIRLCKRLKDDFDILISTADEIDLGRSGVQYVNYPNNYKLYQEQRSEGLSLRSLMNRLRPWRLISGYSFERMKQNLTIVNSDWSGRMVKKRYGLESITVFPPVAGQFPEVGWEQREKGFVCIGRIVPEKRLEILVEILTAVRDEAPDISFSIIGTQWPDALSQAYYKRIKNLVNKNAEWLSLHENVSREELVQLVSRHRYGIHAHPEEHFGIAVAEMVSAGCIVFTPNDGGQVEILDNDERLLFATVDEAATKILAVLRSSQEQESIRAYLAKRKELFTAERFMRNIRSIIRQVEKCGTRSLDSSSNGDELPEDH